MLMSNKCSNAVMFAVIPIPILSHLRRPYGAKPLTKQIGSLLIIVDSSWWFLIIDPSELLQDKLWILDHSRIIWCSLIIHYWWLLNNWLLIINDYSRIIWWSLIIHYWWLLHLLSIIWNNLESSGIIWNNNLWSLIALLILFKLWSLAVLRCIDLWPNPVRKWLARKKKFRSRVEKSSSKRIWEGAVGMGPMGDIPMVPWLSMVDVFFFVPIFTKSWGIWEFWEIIYPVVGSPLIIFFYLYASCQHHISTMWHLSIFSIWPFSRYRRNWNEPKRRRKRRRKIFPTPKTTCGVSQKPGRIVADGDSECGWGHDCGENMW